MVAMRPSTQSVGQTCSRPRASSFAALVTHTAQRVSLFDTHPPSPLLTGRRFGFRGVATPGDGSPGEQPRSATRLPVLGSFISPSG